MGLKIKILSKTELNRMPKHTAQRLAAAAAASADASTASAAPAASAASKSAKSATAAISGSSVHRSADRMAGGGSAATRAAPPPHTKSSHPPEPSVAAHSTTKSSHHTEHCATSRHSEKFVSMADFVRLSRKFDALECTTTETSSRLAQVEEDVRETKGDTKEILALMRKEKEQAMLPAPPKKKAIMPPPTDVSTESESEEDEIEYVMSGKGEQERLFAVPKWGKKKKKSTPVACKGGSATASSSQRKDLSRASGGGEMVVSSRSKQKSLPLPETLGRSGKERSSSPRIEGLRGTGLVQCTDLKSLVNAMKDDGYTEVPVIVVKTKDMSIHFKTAIANAHDIGDDEAQMLAMLSADSGRSATLIPDACQIREEVIDCFSPRNVGMFMQFFARMAENYHSNPKNGVEISGQLYSYVVLGTDVQYCTSFLKYLRRN